MLSTIQWITLPGLVAGSPCPAWAVTYLSLVEAQRAVFPGARLEKLEVRLTPDQRKAIEKVSGVKVRNPRPDVWKADSGGWFLVDEVIGKHDFITYALGLTADGAVKQLEVMDYRENYGGEVRRPEWRAQFSNKKHGAKLKLDEDIKNITGATLSCRHLVEGVKRLLTTYDLVLKGR